MEMTAGPLASWIRRSVPAVVGLALSMSVGTGRRQLGTGAQWVTGCAAHVEAGASTVWACRR